MQLATNKIIKLAVLSALFASTSAHAGGITYQDGDKYLKIGGRLQMQYHQVNPDEASTTDEVFFRRLRPYIEGSTHKDWKAKIQWDMGKAEDENEIAVKDAYFQYSGVKNMKVTIGNASFPFSREFLTSSKYQQLVERTFVGDHNYGTPDRNVGLHLTGHNDSKKFTWAASGTMASVDPDVKKLDFDSPVNSNSDFNEGFMVGGRLDYHPLGHMKFSQGDFSKKTKVTISVAAYNWNNDNDNNTYTGITPPSTSKADIDSVTGLEISGAFRAAGFSVDAEYNSFDADTVENDFTGGIYTNGSTTLSNASIEGGYMIKDTIEIVAAYETQDADGYDTSWDRKSIGANWFINKNDTKVQLTYRKGENLNGVKNNDEDEIFVQTQFVF
ncbi:MAG: porin [Gammaproteobacteria bacterium]|nr:porin [Gammaproteobacteria bacterium]